MQVYVNVKLSVVLKTLLRNEAKTKTTVTNLNKEMKTRYECKQTAFVHFFPGILLWSGRINSIA